MNRASDSIVVEIRAAEGGADAKDLVIETRPARAMMVSRPHR